jgi:hypothetical protein
MAGTPAQNGNAASGSNDFSRKAEALAAQLMWTTPQAHDATMRGAGQVPTAKAGNACLARDATTWPAPAARDMRGSSPASVTRANGKSRMDHRDCQTEQGFFRPAPMMPQAGKPSWHPRQTWRLLRLYVIATHGRATWRRLQASGGKRRLNPAFVGSLMGWPPGHSLCACSETEFSRWQQDMRGALLRLPTASAPWIWKPPIDAPVMVQIDMFGETA